MKITCSNCQTAYQVADEKIPSGGARANCPNCGQEILVPGVKGAGAYTPLSGETSADYGQTMSFDFQEIDQSRSEAAGLMGDVSERQPFLTEGVSYELRDTASGKIYALGSPQVTVGRSGTDIIVDDSEVSRNHCILRIFGDHLMIIDAKSTNGTFIGGRKIMIARLEFGETFTIGNTTLETLAN